MKIQKNTTPGSWLNIISQSIDSEIMTLHPSGVYHATDSGHIPYQESAHDGKRNDYDYRQGRLRSGCATILMNIANPSIRVMQTTIMVKLCLFCIMLSSDYNNYAHFKGLVISPVPRLYYQFGDHVSQICTIPELSG
jgi:hypothetical protein